MILLAIIILYMGNGRKKYYFCTTIILTLLGSLYLVGYKKFSFLDDTPLWSVSRMMLFIPVNIALSFFLFLPDSYKRVGFKPMVVLPFAVVFLVFSLVFKWSDFQRRKNTLTSSSFHYIYNVKEITTIAENDYQFLKEEKKLGVFPHPMIANIIEATHYGDVCTWSYGGINRDTHAFLRELNTERQDAVFFSSFSDYTVIPINNDNIVHWLFNNFGTLRSEYYSQWDGKN